MAATVSLHLMKIAFRLIALILFYLGFALPALAHEFWLDPVEFQVETGATLQVKLRNGQNFKGSELGYFDNRAQVFDWIQNGTRHAVQARTGDFPALTMAVPDGGLMVLVYQSAFSTLRYNKWQKFQAFADHKDFPDIKARHEARSLPRDGFSEIYTRYCKSLVAVGGGAGQDAPTGIETEFVALSNPYTDDLTNGLMVQLLYQGMIRAGAQVEIFEQAPNGTVTVTTMRTDDQGHAAIPVKSGHTYMLDAVVLREPSAEIAADRGVVWETIWASLTFAVPDYAN